MDIDLIDVGDYLKDNDPRAYHRGLLEVIKVYRDSVVIMDKNGRRFRHKASRIREDRSNKRCVRLVKNIPIPLKTYHVKMFSGANYVVKAKHVAHAHAVAVREVLNCVQACHLNRSDITVAECKRIMPGGKAKK